jgi:thioredoxin 1
MSLKEFDTLIHADHPLLICFYADWCEPCKILDKVLDDAKPKLDEKITIHKIDIDESSEIADQYGIMSVPVLIIFRNGKEKWRMNGFTWAEELTKKVLSYV